MSLVEFTLRPAALPGASPHVIGIVVCDQFPLLEAARIADVFDKANRLHAGQLRTLYYQTVFLSLHGEHVYSASRVAVLTQQLAEPCAFRALFVASGLQASQTPHMPHMQPAPQTLQAAHDTRFAAWLRAAAAHLGSICTLGDGAVAAALDTVRADLGADLAYRVATQLSEAAPVLPGPAALEHLSIAQKIRDSARWIARNCDKPITVTVAAQTASMSERSYLRHFRAEMGVKPSEYVRRVRVDRACALLVASDLPVDKIARRCGLTSGECLARLFRQIKQISPTEYRIRAQHHSV
ncbi:helix-turn-helix domain-containing protein [Paraburkholderia jirisanensis]